MDTVGGEGSHRFIAIAKDNIPEKNHGIYNTFVHEFGHLLHQSGFSKTQIEKLESLYKNAKNKKIFYNVYASTNESEYFACSLESYVTDTKIDKSWHGYADERKDLLKRDPEMFQFIKELVDYGSLQNHN